MYKTFTRPAGQPATAAVSALRLSALCLAMALAGCSLAPKYVRPDAPVAPEFPPDVTVSGQTPVVHPGNKAAPDIGWREFFTDPRLQALIAAALENNRDLRTAALRIEEARAQYNIQAADLLPNVNGTASTSRSRTPADLSVGGTSAMSRRYDVGVSLASFELDFFGRVRSLNDAALSQYLSTEEARNSAQISLIAEVAKAYLNERSFAEQLELTRRTLEARSTALDLARKRFDVGASSALDLRQAEGLLESARVAETTLARQRAQAENALTLLVGRPLTDLPPPQTLSSEQLVTDIAPGLPSDLLTRRPDIRASEQRLLAANANIGAARAAFFPRITLTGNFGTASRELSGLFDAGSRSWSFAPQLVLPIFDAGRNRANLNLAEVRKNLAIVDYEKNIQTAFREVSDTLGVRGVLEEQVRAQQAFLRTQADRLQLSELRFQNGIASTLDVLDAQRELFAAEQQLVQVRLLRLTNAIDLYRSLGGGIAADSKVAASSTAASPAATSAP